MSIRRKQPPATSPLLLDGFLCFAIYSANHAFNRVYQPLLRALDLTYPQFITMITLWADDGLPVGEVADRLFLQSNTLTPLLKRLEQLGYVSRKRDGADERLVRVYVTDAGRELKRHASHVVQKVRNATGLHDDRMARLLDEVGALRAALERHVES